MIKNIKINKTMDKVNVEMLFTISNTTRDKGNFVALLGEYFKIEGSN